MHNFLIEPNDDEYTIYEIGSNNFYYYIGFYSDKDKIIRVFYPWIDKIKLILKDPSIEVYGIPLGG